MRYQNERKNKKNDDRLPPGLPFILHRLRYNDSTKFREYLRVSPATFDHIVEEIGDDSEFTNNSKKLQLPVDFQLGLVLYRFGHYGNAMSLSKVADWAGIGKGTVESITRRVLRAVLKKPFRDNAIRLPTSEEKEAAKQWVEEHSCRAWRDGWCMVDGTLVTLYHRPYWYGESYFDRKSRYSLNFQVRLLLPFFSIKALIYFRWSICQIYE
ncbi:hypothetical protein DFH11DRAFT_1507594 [Phellopilus nigrolimitatus]|nr:hypothetical protein DFH11DRAFT_1507594 [Phellopilus nigrolimitatus]